MTDRKPYELHDLRLARRRQPLPIPACATRIIGALGGDKPDTGKVQFTLKRAPSRGGTDVWLHAYGRHTFSWSLSMMEGHFPPNFKAARQWVAAYGARHGQMIEEAPPREPPLPRLTKAERAAIADDRVPEAWLSSDKPQLWAEAMIRCDHPAGYCGEDGECHYPSRCRVVTDQTRSA